jgi:hypothetical protein
MGMKSTSHIAGLSDWIVLSAAISANWKYLSESDITVCPYEILMIMEAANLVFV